MHGVIVNVTLSRRNAFWDKILSEDSLNPPPRSGPVYSTHNLIKEGSTRNEAMFYVFRQAYRADVAFSMGASVPHVLCTICDTVQKPVWPAPRNRMEERILKALEGKLEAAIKRVEKVHGPRQDTPEWQEKFWTMVTNVTRTGETHGKHPQRHS